MWNVLLLFIIQIEFNCGSTLELMEISEVPEFLRARSDTIQEKEETAELNAENYSLGKKLSDDRLTEKWLDDSHVNLDLKKTFNQESIKSLRLTERKSIYNEPSQYSNDYELNDEEYQAPRPRKRRPPQNYEYSPSKTSNLLTSPKIQESFSSQDFKESSPSQDVNQISQNSELKSLLKTQQFGGFSLSEILQQQNLSLNDLLKGKTEIISALKLADSENDKIEGIAIANDNNQPNNNNNNNDTDYPEMMISTENAGFPGDWLSEKYKIVSTTETISSEHEIMEFSDYPKNKGKNSLIIVDNEDVNTTADVDNDLTPTEPMTLDVSMPKETDKFNVVLKNEEPSEQTAFDPTNFDYQNDEQPSDSRDFEDIESDEKIVKNSDDNSSLLNHRTVIPNSKIYEEMILEIEPEARAEILELINSTSLAQKLEDLLKARNMSLDELIALRQRGFSSVHLSQVNPSERQARLNKDEILLFNYSNTKNTNIPNINFSNNDNDVKKKPIIIDLSIEKFRKNRKSEENNQESLQLIDFFSAVESLPFAIRTNFTINNSNNTQEAMQVEKIDESEEETFDYNATKFSEPSVVDEIHENYEISTIKNLIENFIDNSDDGSSSTLSKIQPSIIASCSILAMAIISFLLIFIVLRIRQKKKITYTSSFPRGILQTPAVNTRRLSNCNSSNRFMVNIGATTSNNNCKEDMKQVNNEIYEIKSDIENDSLDANDSWDTIPDFMK